MELPCIPPSPRPDPAAGPRFCPRCGHVAPEEPTLCRECGEALASQGYCDVCESHWPLAPGNPCPKHELALEPRGRRAATHRFPALPEKGVTRGGFADALRAEAPRIRRGAEGIPTFLEG